jgi:hypothetical protein
MIGVIASQDSARSAADLVQPELLRYGVRQRHVTVAAGPADAHRGAASIRVWRTGKKSCLGIRRVPAD